MKSTSVKNTAEMMRVLTSRTGATLADVSAAFGMTRKAFYSRTRTGRGKFSLDEWEKLAIIFGCTARMQLADKETGEVVIEIYTED